jgi:glycosyltransferase involved in cell wall biosynthesis
MLRRGAAAEVLTAGCQAVAIEWNRQYARFGLRTIALIPSTVVASIDKRHSYETALAYQEVGALRRFVTGLFLSPKSATAVRGALPGLGAKLAKRSDPRLDSSLVVSMALTELLPSAAGRVVGGKIGWDLLQRRNVLFDRRCAKRLSGAGAVHGFECTSLSSFEAAKQEGMRTILDAPTVHHATWRRIVEEEVVPAAPKEGRAHLEALERTRERKDHELALADLVLVPSEWCAGTFRSELPKERRIAIAPYGAPVRRGEPTRPSGKPRFLCLTSGLGLLKGTHLLLEGFAPLCRDAELWLAGPVLPELSPFLAAHGDSVRLFGWVSPSQIQNLFDQCHAFVFPSLCESSSLAVLEAMGQGLPVVVTPRCGSPVDDGLEGIVVPPGNAHAITDALSRLGDPDLRRRMGERAKVRAASQSWMSYRESVRRCVAATAEAVAPNSSRLAEGAA